LIAVSEAYDSDCQESTAMLGGAWLVSPWQWLAHIHFNSSHLSVQPKSPEQASRKSRSFC